MTSNALVFHPVDFGEEILKLWEKFETRAIVIVEILSDLVKELNCFSKFASSPFVPDTILVSLRLYFDMQNYSGIPCKASARDYWPLLICREETADLERVGNLENIYPVQKLKGQVVTRMFRLNSVLAAVILSFRLFV